MTSMTGSHRMPYMSFPQCRTLPRPELSPSAAAVPARCGRRCAPAA
jgi:hypothetical protein